MPVIIAGAAIGAYGATQGKETKSSGTSIGGSRVNKKSELNLMDKASKARLDRLTGNFSKIVADQKPFDPNAAAALASGQVRSIFDAYQKSALPQIADMGNRGGSYDSTAHQLMANDAFAEATNKAASTVLDTIQKQQQLKMAQDAQDQQTLLNALNLQAQVTQRSKTKGSETTMGQVSGALTTTDSWANGAIQGGMAGVSARTALG